MVLLLAGLGLHLLHLDGVGFPPPHVQLVVPHAERQHALVDAQTRRVEYKVLQYREEDSLIAMETTQDNAATTYIFR